MVSYLITLQWSSGGAFSAVPASAFYTKTLLHFHGSPFSAVAFPAATCGSLSMALGPGVSLATAGVMSTFLIQARDFLGNIKRDAQNPDEFVVRVRYHDGVTRDGRGAVSALGDGR